MFAIRYCPSPQRLARLSPLRYVSTLSNNPHIKAFPLPESSASSSVYLLTYLSSDPPARHLAIGTTTALPPTPRSFRENERFLPILNEVLARYASKDEGLISQAKAFASPGGAGLSFIGSGGGAASHQGGAGGGGVGGWVHLSDSRNPPDFGRIAWPEDILGSVEVDGKGNLQDNFQASGTYRILTNEGILGLSDFLREKLVERLKQEESK